MQKANGELVPGGLAMVYGLVVSVQLNGISVVTERYVESEEIAPDGSKYVDGPGWFCTSDSIHGNGVNDSNGWSYFNARNLMPINPEADPLHVSEREKCQA